MNKNKRHLLEEDWSSPTPMFPERRSGIIIRDEEVELFLFWGAKLRDVSECQIGGCAHCEAADRFWWDWCNSLHGANRVRLQRELRDRGIPLPPHPGDDLEPTN